MVDNSFGDIHASAMAIPGMKSNDISPSSYSQSFASPKHSYTSNNSKSYSAASHAEKRANHNAIERARRESLNVRFMELAQSIPSLVHVRKPSKSVIVSRSIEYIAETKQRLEVKTRSLQLIRQQNEELKLEINRLRSKMGMGPVLFPDNIDLDLVYEANLEHQREVESRQAPSEKFFPQIAGSFRTGSPFDRNSIIGEEEDEDERSTYGSLMSPMPMEDNAHSTEFRRLSSNNFLTQDTFAGSNPSHSLLGNALNTRPDLKPVNSNNNFMPQMNPQMTPQSLPNFPVSMGSSMVQPSPLSHNFSMQQGWNNNQNFNRQSYDDTMFNQMMQ